MLEASAFQALQAQAPYRGIIKPPVELVVHDLACEQIFQANKIEVKKWQLVTRNCGNC